MWSGSHSHLMHRWRPLSPLPHSCVSLLSVTGRSRTGGACLLNLFSVVADESRFRVTERCWKSSNEHFFLPFYLLVCFVADISPTGFCFFILKCILWKHFLDFFGGELKIVIFVSQVCFGHQKGDRLFKTKNKKQKKTVIPWVLS
jgi:hypothetical protein